MIDDAATGLPVPPPIVVADTSHSPIVVVADTSFLISQLATGHGCREMETLEENQTWSLVENPLGCMIIESKWVYSVKLTVVGKIDCYKACLVSQG
ncbi:hypothetical protein HAX54_008213 [Datura stramonium]|uniref:Uncharacterized protein n=1 Tax=Datura stramonium TaxID=4076 RepID=A0ABS8TEG1_DATST|nr:hypothetical protein [Datura stramonium]